MDLFRIKRFGLSAAKRKAPSKELQLRFLHRLARLLKNGYALIRALEIIQWDKQLKLLATSVISSLKSGSPFDEALEYARFSPVVTSYLYLVRNNGDMVTNLEKCITMFEQRFVYMKKFQETARYPLILLIVFTFLLYFIKQSILPTFLDFFQGAPETVSTFMLAITLIDTIGYFFIGFLFILGLGFVIWHLNKSKIDIDKQIRLYTLIPIYRQYKQMQISFLFAIHISSLLKSGLSIREVLINMSKQKKQPILAHYASLLTNELSHGIYVTNLLANLPLIDKQLSIIFQKHSDVQALEKDLTVYSELQTEETHRKIMKTITYIQPIFFVILGGMIVTIYISLMWPMFQLIKTI
ncbi:type II secretion system F family protein [Lentibacillus cibarius]|uniref:Chromosome partitioning protein ParA n=1 Tax=Lentibacillus cibarius TaxID=2583219 RepID=A0A5S3QKI9_9BACI|nr:type II secretion system F family protein [Lentibacillus cibarius]TMN20956.1 chromosome partitioning protein ParA [Lentibacillus cibarius]